MVSDAPEGAGGQEGADYDEMVREHRKLLAGSDETDISTAYILTQALF